MATTGIVPEIASGTTLLLVADPLLTLLCHVMDIITRPRVVLIVSMMRVLRATARVEIASVDY